jgi:hypothetical protein
MLLPWQSKIRKTGQQTIFWFAVTGLLSLPEMAFADLLTPIEFLLDYNVGLEVGDTNDTVAFLYHQPEDGSYRDAKICESTGKAGRESLVCQLDFVQRDSNFSVFIEHPFERQGFWHLDWDVGISLKHLSGEFKSETTLPSNAPVKQMTLNMFSLNARPYVTFGITPKEFWPDLLLSLGTTGEALFGSFELDDQRYHLKSGVFRRSRVLSFAFWELQVVFWRFGKGYLAFNMNHSNVTSAVSSKPEILAEESVGLPAPDLELRRNFFGLKLLFK